jgi:5'(3')-deoxyribonucleotidase
MKKIIAVDIDDVLAVFAEEFVKFSNDKWSTSLQVDDYTEHWSEMWQINKDQTNDRAKEWYASGFTGSLPANQTAKEVLEELSKLYELVITTSRHSALRVETEEWINKNFEGIFATIHFAGIWEDQHSSHEELIKVTKAELCKKIGADFLIDDQPKHCIAASEAGINALLFGEYSWNRKTASAPRLHKVSDWQDVKKYFDEQG